MVGEAVGGRVPVVDLRAEPAQVARAIDAACREHGFFQVTGHGVDAGLIRTLERLAHRFFALPEATKARYAMRHGGRAWRGWFPLGGELTSGRPDWKEGLYLGAELPPNHPRVVAGRPLHGANLLPDERVLPGFHAAILAYMHSVTQVGHVLCAAMARALGLPADYFAQRYTADPLILFRLFLYPSRPVPEAADVRFGVGEHTDYGLLTLLWQDDVGGLEVRTREGWIAVPPRADTFVCNIGDMLERMTGGLYRSTPHRVRVNTSGRDRLSMPLFFDPDMDARIEPIDMLLGRPIGGPVGEPVGEPRADDAVQRWDGRSPHDFTGTYGEYLLAKIGKVFPELGDAVL